MNVNFGIITFFGFKFSLQFICCYIVPGSFILGETKTERNHDKVIKQLKVKAVVEGGFKSQ